MKVDNIGSIPITFHYERNPESERKVRRLFSKLIHTLAPTQGSETAHKETIESFGKRLLALSQSPEFELGEECERLHALMTRLQTKGAKLASGEIRTLFSYYEKIYQNVAYTDAFISGFGDIDQRRVDGNLALLNDSAKEKRFIFIPLLVNRGGGHITLLGIDREKEQFFYYDSMGNLPPDKLFSDNVTFESFIRSVEKHCDVTLTQAIEVNAQFHQDDLYNCGCYITMTAMRILEGESIDSIYNTPWGQEPHLAIQSDRAHLAHSIQQIYRDADLRDWSELEPEELIEDF